MNKNALKWKVCRLADISKNKRKKENKTNKNFHDFSVIYNYQLFIIKAQKVSQKCVQQSSKLFSAGIATICHHRKRKIQKQSDKTSLKFINDLSSLREWKYQGKCPGVFQALLEHFTWQFITNTSWNSVRFTYSFIFTWISSEPLRVTEGYLTSWSTYVVTPLRGCTNMHRSQFRNTSISVNNKYRYFFQTLRQWLHL